MRLVARSLLAACCSIALTAVRTGVLDPGHTCFPMEALAAGPHLGLVVAVVRQRGPQDGEDQDPHVVGLRVVAPRGRPQGAAEVPHVQLACAYGAGSPLGGQRLLYLDACMQGQRLIRHWSAWTVPKGMCSS